MMMMMMMMMMMIMMMMIMMMTPSKSVILGLKVGPPRSYLGVSYEISPLKILKILTLSRNQLIKNSDSALK